MKTSLRATLAALGFSLALAPVALHADCSPKPTACPCSAAPAATVLYSPDLAPLAPTDIAIPSEPTLATARPQGFQISPHSQLLTETEPTATVAAHQR